MRVTGRGEIGVEAASEQVSVRPNVIHDPSVGDCPIGGNIPFPLARPDDRDILERMDPENEVSQPLPRLDVRKLLPEGLKIRALMRKVGRRSYPQFHAILAGRGPCAPGLAILIEAETGGEVPRYALRPDLWMCPSEAAIRIEKKTGGDLPRFLLRPDLWDSHIPSAVAS